MKIDPARIEAHRGASSAFPENTMLAFEAAHRAGALSIETDMSLLADGSFAIFHDDRLGRTVSGDAMIGSLGAEEVRQLDAGAWRGAEFAGAMVPLLDDLLDWQETVGIRFNLEMKCHGTRQGEAASALAAHLAGCDLSALMVSSFDAAFLAAIRTTLPALPRALIAGTLPPDWRDLSKTLDLEALHLDHETVTPQMVTDIHAAGMKCRVYTVNKAKDMTRMRDAGVDTMITDLPETFL